MRPAFGRSGAIPRCWLLNRLPDSLTYGAARHVRACDGRRHARGIRGILSGHGRHRRGSADLVRASRRFGQRYALLWLRTEFVAIDMVDRAGLWRRCFLWRRKAYKPREESHPGRQRLAGREREFSMMQPPRIAGGIIRNGACRGAVFVVVSMHVSRAAVWPVGLIRSLARSSSFLHRVCQLCTPFDFIVRRSGRA